MAVLFFEKFSRYALGGTGWTNFSDQSDDIVPASTSQTGPTSGSGRFGDNAAKMITNIKCTMTNKLTSLTAPASTTFVMGWIAKQYRIGDAANQQTFSATTAAGSSYHFQMSVLDNGAIEMYNAAVSRVAVSAPRVIRLNRFHHIELKVNCLDSPSGTYEVRVDGVSIFSGTGDFRNGIGNTSALQEFYFANGLSTGWEVDSFYILDGTGTQHNDFLGDIRFEYAVANADGASGANWTPLSSTNISNIDDALGAYDSDTTYISSATATQQNFSNHATLSGTGISGSPIMVGIAVLCRNDGSNTLKELARRSGTTITVVPAPSAQALTYAWKTAIFLTDPGTGSAWTSVANVNATEFGVEAV